MQRKVKKNNVVDNMAVEEIDEAISDIDDAIYSVRKSPLYEIDTSVLEIAREDLAEIKGMIKAGKKDVDKQLIEIVKELEEYIQDLEDLIEVIRGPKKNIESLADAVDALDSAVQHIRNAVEKLK